MYLHGAVPPRAAHKVVYLPATCPPSRTVGDMRAAYVQFLRRLRPLAVALALVVVAYAVRLGATASAPPTTVPPPDLLCAEEGPCTGPAPETQVLTAGAELDLRRFAPVVSVSLYRSDGRPTNAVRYSDGTLHTEGLEPGEYHCFVVALDGTAVELLVTLLPS